MVTLCVSPKGFQPTIDLISSIWYSNSVTCPCRLIIANCTFLGSVLNTSDVILTFVSHAFSSISMNDDIDLLSDAICLSHTKSKSRN